VKNLYRYNPDRLTQTQLWLLLLSGVLTEQNEVRHDTLYGYEATKEHIYLVKQALERDWGIRNREDLYSSLNWLLHSGHRTDFNRNFRYISLLPYSLEEKELNRIPSGTSLYNSYQLSKLNKYILPRAGIAAWDFGRYITLCRDGALIKYISDKEAWELMAKIGPMAQQSYSSWYEYGLAYMVGRLAWLDKLTEENVKWHVDLLRRLLFKEDSPWLKIPWDIALDI